MEGLQTRYAKMMDGFQVEQAKMKERLTESEQRALEANEKAKFILTESDERAARVEEQAKQQVCLLQAKQAVLEERLMESERQALEANENVKRIQTQADERGRAEELAKQHIQAKKYGLESRIGSSSAEMSGQEFVQVETNVMGDGESGFICVRFTFLNKAA